MSVTAYEGQSLTDICGIGSLFAVARANGLSLTETFAGGETVQAEASPPDAAADERQQAAKTIGAGQVIVFAGQNLLDLTLETEGAVDGLFAVMRLNDLGATPDFVPGTALKARAGAVRKDVRDWYARTWYARTGQRVNTGAAELAEDNEGEFNADYNEDYLT